MPQQFLSDMASGLVGSEILKIAGEINQLKSQGKKIINFTVGDFDPQYFPIPKSFGDLILNAVKELETNYPPSSGIMPLREAVAKFYTREFGYETKASEVLIAGGARPIIYSIFTTLLNPGDVVINPVPSWNNNHYSHLSRCEMRLVESQAKNNFLPTPEDLAPHLKDARLLCLNSPLNPTGTVLSEKTLKDICLLVVEENNKRKATGARPLFLMYDQIYFKLVHGSARHHNPVSLVPEIRPYTIFVDGISKYLCSTGLRVGWGVIPENMLLAFSNVLGHVGAWAPKPEQVATARFLSDPQNLSSFLAEASPKITKRLGRLYEGIEALKKKGLGVNAIEPQGGIYLSLQILPSAKKGLHTNEDIRREVLNQANLAIVPFQAFGCKKDDGWFRLSVGAVSEEEIPTALESLEKFLIS